MIAAGSLRVFLAVSLVAAALCPRAWASAWALDPSATRIEFSVRNLSVARVDGTFRLASGHVTLDDEDPSRSTIEAVIDATSVEEAFPPGPFNQHFDLFVGTSAGAVTAAFVANGAQPSEMFRALRDDLDSPFNFRPEDVFGAPAGNMNVVAAQELMQEVFASLGPRHPR